MGWSCTRLRLSLANRVAAVSGRIKGARLPRFQFSLRAVFLLVLVVAIYLGIFNSLRKQPANGFTYEGKLGRKPSSAEVLSVAGLWGLDNVFGRQDADLVAALALRIARGEAGDGAIYHIEATPTVVQVFTINGNATEIRHYQMELFDRAWNIEPAEMDLEQRIYSLRLASNPSDEELREVLNGRPMPIRRYPWNYPFSRSEALEVYRVALRLARAESATAIVVVLHVQEGLIEVVTLPRKDASQGIDYNFRRGGGKWNVVRRWVNDFPPRPTP